MGHAAGLHHGLHVGKVQVDQRGHGDQVADALDALAQHVVGNAEGLQHGGTLADHLQQPVVGDHHQGVHPLLQVSDAHFGVLHALLALKGKGLGDHGDGQRADIPRHLGHNGGRAGAGAAAHTGGDKHQVCALERLGDFLAALLRRAAAHLGHSAGTKALGQLLTNLNLGLRAAEGQGLTVGIDGNELNAAKAGVDHAVDGVVAAAAAAHHLDRRKIIGFNVILEFDHFASS